MATLTAWKFGSPYGADDALATLEKLQGEALIQVQDAAVVSWEPGARKPKTHEMHSTKRAGALGGAFWGFLFGLIFFVPFLGAAIGAGMGAMMGSLADVGISDAFIDNVRRQVTPGTSALFLLSSDAVFDRVKAEFADTNPELISTNLSGDQEERLREAFSHDDD
jgi:uncharacterized membrane protein